MVTFPVRETKHNHVLTIQCKQVTLEENLILTFALLPDTKMT